MSTKDKPIATIPEIAQVDTLLSDMSKAAAPMIQRHATARDRIDLAIKELESERFELLSRRDLLRRQVEAVEEGLQAHLDDIDATMRLYEGGVGGKPLGDSA